MSSIWVILSYTSAVVCALLLLNHFHARRWYWHALSFGAAVGIGFYSPPEAWRGPMADLTVGWLFTLFFLLAIAAPLFRIRRTE